MNSRGFTILELIIVLAIIGILSALAVPDLSAFTQRLRLVTTVRSISSDMREMKMMAALERSNRVIHFDSDNNCYELPDRKFLLPPGIRFGFGPNVLGPPGNPSKTPDSDGVTFQSNRATFYLRGSNSLGTVYITSDDNITMAVSLSITGRVKIWRWDGQDWI